jgi:TIR domain
MPTAQIFVSYSHQDDTFRHELETNLKPYLRAGSFTSYSDQQIAPGSQWFPEIESALANSKIAVLLVSPDFLASDFIHEHELGPLLNKAEQGGVKILWVSVRDSSYKVTPLNNYQAVHDPRNALAKMTQADRDSAWVTICEKIEKAVQDAKTAKAIHNIELRQVEQEQNLAKQEAELRAIQIALRGILTNYELGTLTFWPKTNHSFALLG